MIKAVLLKIAKLFNEANIVYTLGGSTILNYYGIDYQANDIDFIILDSDFIKASQILKQVGIIQKTINSDQFFSTYFSQYLVDNVMVDLIANFKIKYNNELYEYPFNKAAINKVILDNNIKINLPFLEDWYLLYLYINQNSSKILLIEAYFKDYKINKDRMNYLITDVKEDSILERIEKLL